jgi:hypothetical protein
MMLTLVSSIFFILFESVFFLLLFAFIALFAKVLVADEILSPLCYHVREREHSSIPATGFPPTRE